MAFLCPGSRSVQYTAELSRYGIRTVKGLNFKKFGRMPTADYRYGTVRNPSR